MKQRAALYYRVSREDLHADNQKPDVERLVATRGLQVVRTYEETASAAKKRPLFDALMRDAHRGLFDVVLIWSLDRLGRSLHGNVAAVLALDRAGVQLVSTMEPWLDTGGPVRGLLVAIFGWLAEQERTRLIERTRAGLARARSKGVRLGRPTRSIDLRHAGQLLAEGLSARAVARRLGVSASTLREARRRAEKGALADGGNPSSSGAPPA